MSRWSALLLLCGCLPDGTIDLLPDAGGGQGGVPGAGGTGGVPGTGAAGGDPSAGGHAGAPGCRNNAECQAPTPMCDSGRCVPCPAGMQECAGECVDTHADPAHCGGCNAPCAAGEFCHEGTCACLPWTEKCDDGVCHDLGSDPDHCGACSGSVCPAGHKCENGHCLSGDCSPGLTACVHPGDRVACVNLTLGYPRCGSCDVTCAGTEVCVGNHCQAYQPAAPCNACPCDSCAASLGEGSSCCDHVHGSAAPMCVAGSGCP